MSRNMRWLLVAAALLVLLLVIMVPLAFMYGRFIAEDSVVPSLEEPTRADVVIIIPTTMVPTEYIPQVTQTPVLTNTPLPTATPLPTNTPLPTATPLPTFSPTPVTPTLVPTPVVPCNWAQFVADVTVPDGSVFVPGEKFTKTWRLKNIGTCTWSTEYSLNFVSGTEMTVNNTIVYLKQLVPPGETVDVAVKLTAPADPGVYQGNWIMKNPGGLTFGLGDDADVPVFVRITVVNVDPDGPFDFVRRICEATWRNGEGEELTCPMSPTGADGFVSVLANPFIENRQENEPALWGNPDHREGGKIKGTYPAYAVQPGDHFKAWIGCIQDKADCNVAFEFAYSQDGGEAVDLGTWNETLDGSSQMLDIDLSFLAGSNVRFILKIKHAGNDYADNHAYWFAPRIVNEAP